MDYREPQTEDTQQTLGPEYGYGNGAEPGQPFTTDRPEWQALFDAPDLTALLRPAQSRKAKEYADKVNSILKAGLVASINAQDYPDAAAILRHGPGFANAAGQLADASPIAANILDLITAPASPLTMFVLTGLPLISQIMRNHEAQLQQAPETWRQRRAMRKAAKEAGVRAESKPRATINILGRKIPIKVNIRMPNWGKVLQSFRTQTAEPRDLAMQVFSDPQLIAALRKQGIIITTRTEPRE